MGWRDTISRWLGTADERSSLMSYPDYLPWVNFGGHTYWLTGSLAQTLTSDREEPARDYVSLVDWAYRTNAVVAACIDVRIKHFSEARFQFQRLRDGRPGELFGTGELGILERPWPGGTTGDLLARMMQDADFAGNAYVARVRSGGETILTRLRPDWVTIVLGSNMEPTEPAFAVDALTIGYLYHPGGPALGREPIILRPEQVAHFAPIPDPTANYRGMSWVSAVIREISADTGMTEHKRMYVQNGATPNLVVTLKEPISPESFNEWVAKFGQRHEGAYNAYRTMYLAGGADAKVVGSDLAQVDFKSVQGAGETRIAAAAGVPPVIVGLSEGLAAATYSNYGQARRRFADGTMRPLWRNVAGSLERIVRVPSGARLWIDDRDILFLQEDMKDRADIQAVQAQAIRSLVDAGFVPETVVAAVQADDFGQLKHSQLYSVQLRPPGNENEIVPNSEPIAPQNGNGAQGNPNRPPSRWDLLDLLLARADDDHYSSLRHRPGGHDHFLAALRGEEEESDAAEEPDDEQEVTQ